MKEKTIEKQIIQYLQNKGAWVEGLQSGSVMIKKGAYVNRMNLCSNGTPDIICLYKGTLYAIEVKKNEKEYKKWVKLNTRYNNGETLPKSYNRELTQIEHKYKIIDNGGVHILAYNLDEVTEYFDNL